MAIPNLLLLIMLISLVILAVYNYNAGRNLNLKANSNITQFKECRKIANVSECNTVVKELNRELPIPYPRGLILNIFYEITTYRQIRSSSEGVQTGLPYLELTFNYFICNLPNYIRRITYLVGGLKPSVKFIALAPFN